MIGAAFSILCKLLDMLFFCFVLFFMCDVPRGNRANCSQVEGKEQQKQKLFLISTNLWEHSRVTVDQEV